MGEAANVRAIQALTELRNALRRFAGTAQEALAAAEIEICRTQEWLREREAHWRQEVERAREEYEDCLRLQDDEEWDPNCAAEEAALRRAEAELHRVQYWRGRVEVAVAEYRHYANRLKRLATTHTERAEALLERKRGELERYIAVPVPTVAPAVTGEAVVGARVPQPYAIKGSQPEKAELSKALQILESTEPGHQAAKAIREKNTIVRFGPTEGAIARYHPDINEIRVHQSLKKASPKVLAAYLAHEGIHILWDRPNSIDQEYHAFKAEAEVWNEVKGEETDPQCDRVSEVISLGEKEAKRIIRRYYPYLSE